MALPPNYAIIYNWDGAPHGYSEVPQSVADLLEKAYAPLENTQVGALFWCVGEHAARWSSEVLEQLGDVHERRYESAAAFTHTENIRLMLERGEDPQASLIERGHELGIHVYASIRMNDNHFGGAQISDLANLHHTELTEMRRQHPEWLLGDRTSEWFALSWNFAVAEVREHRYEHVKEVCKRYEWDGIELDWQRHAFHFPEDEAYRLRYALTDLQRRVRLLTEEISKERGRPFYLAARVAGSLEMCRRIGYDIPVWIEEGLVDILIPAGGAATDSSIEVARFVELCRGKEIAVYPGFDGGLPGPAVGPEEATLKDRMRTRAIANRYHCAGARGIYTFNWHANQDSRRELLTQVGSRDTLRGMDMIYAATHRFIRREGEWRGAYRIDRIYGEVPVSLLETANGIGPRITLEIPDDFWAVSPSFLELRVRLDQWVKGDEVSVKLDNRLLDGLETTYSMESDPHRISDVSSAVWLAKALNPEDVSPGVRTVEVALVKRHRRVACELVLTDVELVVRYAPGDLDIEVSE